jgi:hypothetical protein
MLYTNVGILYIHVYTLTVRIQTILHGKCLLYIYIYMRFKIYYI